MYMLKTVHIVILQLELQLSKLKEYDVSITSQLACHPKTKENIWHYALSNDKTDIINYLLKNGDESLIMSDYEIEQSGIHGYRNALHILIKKGDIGTAERVLDKITNEANKQAMMKTETAVDIKGQRPRLLSCLHLAAYFDKLDFVDLFLKIGMCINHLNKRKDTALHWAARWGHDTIVDRLLEKHADVESKNDKGSTALHWAVSYQHVKTVKLLLKRDTADTNAKRKNANPNTKRKLGLVAPLVVAAAYGNNEIVQLLLSDPNCDKNISVRGGETPLHHAAKEGHEDVVKTLLQHEAQVNVMDKLGETPLLLAAQNNHISIVDKLIGEGADVFHKNHEGNDVWDYAVDSRDNHLLGKVIAACGERKDIEIKTPPLCIAAARGRNDKIKYLLDTKKHDPLKTDADGNTFLHHAAMNNRYCVIEEFYTYASINSQNGEDDTPLHIACKKGFDRTVKTLLECKAQTDIKNTKKETPLHAAAYSQSITPKTVRKLVSYTIKMHPWETLNETDEKQNNCLHVAGKFARPDVLWQFGAVRLRDHNTRGNTPLHEAVRPGQPDVLGKLF